MVYSNWGLNQMHTMLLPLPVQYLYSDEIKNKTPYIIYFLNVYLSICISYTHWKKTQIQL